MSFKNFFQSFLSKFTVCFRGQREVAQIEGPNFLKISPHGNQKHWLREGPEWETGSYFTTPSLDAALKKVQLAYNEGQFKRFPQWTYKGEKRYIYTVFVGEEIGKLGKCHIFILLLFAMIFNVFCLIVI